MFKRFIVTGGAGFIGSHLVDFLLEKNLVEEVVVLDNLISGKLEFLSKHLGSPKLKFYKVDLRFLDEFIEYFEGVEAVFHFAADPEVRRGSSKPSSMWTNNVIATYNVLEATRRNGVKFLVFASSSTVYGEPSKIPTPENYSPLEPISIYGASKLACEALISGYAHTFKIRSLIIRYANIVGPRLRHGVIYDFIRKLQKNPNQLEILGDGSQRKSYLHISDAIEATWHLFKQFSKTNKLLEIYNIGSEDWVTVKEIAEIVSTTMGLKPKFHFTGGVEGGRGWIGDVKYMLLDISKAKTTGWKPKLNSKEAVKKAAKEIYQEIQKENQNPN